VLQIEKSETWEAQRIVDLQRQISRSNLQEEQAIQKLKVAQKKATEEPMLRNKLEGGKRWKKLSKASIKILIWAHRPSIKGTKLLFIVIKAMATEEEKALSRKVRALKTDLQHNHDNAIQKLRDALAAKDDTIEEDKKMTEARARREAAKNDGMDAKKYQVKDKSDLRNKSA